tara:strand:+ start:11533 stop:11805 length:273 start_codon:yes stop_codon:yes gene_type:complete
MNYYDLKDTVQNLVQHIAELDKKVRYLDTKATCLAEIQEGLMRKIDVLEAEDYDAEKVKSAIKELRVELKDVQKDPNYTPYFIVKLEESQ